MVRGAPGMVEVKKILISLYKGYGLGDGIQVGAVLRHVAAARPDWSIDYQAEEGKHQVGRGIVARHFAYDQKRPDTRYDAEVQVCLYDTWANWGDRPNTRVSSCLHEVFGLPWKPEFGRYKVEVLPESVDSACALLYGWKNKGAAGSRVGRHLRNTPCVAVHYEGDSSPLKKNLTHAQADEICAAVEKMGYTPVVLDWRERCLLPYYRLRVPQDWGRDAEMVCAVISQCAAFVGIDSGPSKCASATDTPALVVWTGHHPAPFHDPAPNTTHLVPEGYHGLEPVCNDQGVIRWFEANHNIARYERDPVVEVKRWLRGVLK